jgi:hypothetical protein
MTTTIHNYFCYILDHAFTEECGQRHKHRGAKANPSVKVGIKASSLGFWECSKAKWFSNNKH